MNRLIVNRGTPAPTVVTGIGGKIESLVNISKAKETGTTVVRRYTGGGTVVVDANSFFVSFIGNFVRLRALVCSHCILMDVLCVIWQSDIGCGKGPRELMRWSEAVYQPVVEATLLPQAKQVQWYK